MTDEMPAAAQIAVPKHAHPPVIGRPPAQVFRFEVGLSSFEAVPGEHVRVHDPASTVVDLMRFRRRFGEPVAHASLRSRVLHRSGPRRPRRCRALGPESTGLEEPDHLTGHQFLFDGMTSVKRESLHAAAEQAGLHRLAVGMALGGILEKYFSPLKHQPCYMGTISTAIPVSSIRTNPWATTPSSNSTFCCTRNPPGHRWMAPTSPSRV